MSNLCAHGDVAAHAQWVKLGSFSNTWITRKRFIRGCYFTSCCITLYIIGQSKKGIINNRALFNILQFIK